MRKLIFTLLLALTPAIIFAQTPFKTFKNDPLNLKQTTLKNGLTVYLIEDHNTPEVFGGLAVKAGGKYDPADATGMAHYLEHMLFKGTTTLGTMDYEKEKVYLDKIDALYDELGRTKDEEKRKQIQLQINENSVKATEYALPNEFPNLINYMGGTSMNAFTTEDMIFFFNNFPPNQMTRFLDIYAHRMDKPVFRLFQSELETVYEEKNQRSETFIITLLEEMLQNAFKNHPYGTQTVIGTAEHLKNPSLTKMYEYFNNYFVANNMALILSGDFDAEEIMPLIEQKFDGMRSGKVPNFTPPSEDPFEGRELIEMAVSPIPLGVMGIRTVPAGHPDEAALEVANNLLFNQGGTGYFNIAATEQKLMGSFIFPFPVFDHGLTIVFFLPKTGEQSIDDAEKVVLEEIKRLTDGNFEEWRLQAAKQQLKMDFLRQMEGLSARGNLVARNFCSNQSWEAYLKRPGEYDAVTKAKVIEVAKKYYSMENYLIITSTQGMPPKNKLEKPGYKPPIPKADTESEYGTYFKGLSEGKPKPRFVDFSSDFTTLKVADKATLYHTNNPLNSIFELDIRFGMGSRSNPMLAQAAEYMNLVGSKKQESELLRQKMNENGLVYSFGASDNYLSINLSGNEDALGMGLSLLQELVTKPEVDDDQVKQIGRGAMAAHQQELANPQAVGAALFDYARYGDKSPYMTRLSAAKAGSRSAKELVKLFKEALSYEAKVHFSGTLAPQKVQSLLQENFFSKVKPSQAEAYVALEAVSYKEPVIYFCERADANQTQIYIHKEGSVWTPDQELLRQAFTRYFGRGFSALVLQEIREYRSLAYNARASIQRPDRAGEKSNFYGFVSTQTDKTNDALDVFMDLITNMPQKKHRLEMVQRGIEQVAYSSRPGFRSMTDWAVDRMLLGYKEDPNQKLAKDAQSLSWDAIYNYYLKEVQNPNQPLVLAITGNSSKFDMAKVEKYGKVIRVSEPEFMKN